MQTLALNSLASSSKHGFVEAICIYSHALAAIIFGTLFL